MISYNWKKFELSMGSKGASISKMLAWMDLEMTGLDPSKHVVVEIATLVTDDDLNIVAEGPDLVVTASNDELDLMDNFVRSMHTRSGLIDEIQKSTLSVNEAGKKTLEFLKQHIPQAQTVPLAGNSIGTDRRFLSKYLPEIEEYLHYRSIDVSTIKELSKRWYPNEAAQCPAKKNSHRALDDIKESIEELKYYRSSIFRPQQ